MYKCNLKNDFQTQGHTNNIPLNNQHILLSLLVVFMIIEL